MSDFKRADHLRLPDTSPIWKNPLTATEAEWLRQKRQKEADETVCPFVGPVMFADRDLVRFCIKDANGGTCSTFTVKPFEECPRWPRRD